MPHEPAFTIFLLSVSAAKDIGAAVQRGTERRSCMLVDESCGEWMKQAQVATAQDWSLQAVWLSAFFCICIDWAVGLDAQ